MSFWLGVVALVTIPATWVAAFKARADYSRRQLIAFTVACLAFAVGIAVSMCTPIMLQKMVDSF